MIAVPSDLSAGAMSAKADVGQVVTTAQVFTTMEALTRADAAAARAIETLRAWRIASRGLLATERKRLREETTERAASDARNVEILARRAG